MHPGDRPLPGTEWRNMVYIDTCLPFGLHSAPQVFNILANLLKWSVQQNGETSQCFVIPYPDDFPAVVPPSSET